MNTFPSAISVGISRKINGSPQRPGLLADLGHASRGGISALARKDISAYATTSPSELNNEESLLPPLPKGGRAACGRGIL